MELADLTGVRRIFLADLEGRSFVDTDERVGIGDALPELRAHRPEMRVLLDGSPSSAPLFNDVGGEIRKSGYVPVLQRGEVIGLVGVEADATFLGGVRSLRNRILIVGAVGLALSLLFAFLLARGFTRPLDRLVDWTRWPAAGDLSRAVPEVGRDEIGQLARTLERMRQHLESQDRELRAMISGVAHEIRNPLGGMRLYTEMLARDSGLSEKHRDRVGKVLGELQQLSNIVDEFLTYARPANPVPETIDILASMEELTHWIGPEATAKSVRFETRGPSVLLHVDPMHFRQIVRNLVGNALQASEAGGLVTVSWTVGTAVGLDPGADERSQSRPRPDSEPYREPDPVGERARPGSDRRETIGPGRFASGAGPAVGVDPGTSFAGRSSAGAVAGARAETGAVGVGAGTVVLWIDDSGPGIAPEVRERIFEPFFTTKIHGAGLGLPICRRLALLNQGRIDLQESPLGGARFRLTLPQGRST